MITFIKYIVTIALVGVCSSGIAFSQIEDLPEIPDGEIGVQDSAFHDDLVAGRYFVLRDQYEEAIAFYDSVLQANPNQPAPHFFLAATYQNWMGTYRFNAHQKVLENHVNDAIKQGESLLKSKPEDPWLNFYIGATYGYRAFFKVLDYNFIGAYRDGRKGIGNLESSLIKEPKLYDVYLGLGSYHYWRTARSTFIRIIAFWMSDKRDLGLKQIRLSADHGIYSGPDAMLGLVVAYIDYEKYEEGLEALNEYFERNDPPLLSSYYYRGRLLDALERYEEAASDFQILLDGLEAVPYSALGYRIECRYWMAKAAYKTGNVEEAKVLVSQAVSDLEKRDEDKELDGPFENFSQIEKWLKELQKDLYK